MPVRKDIITDENDDLKIENGDFVVGESDYQHQKHIIKAAKGEYMDAPLLGVGIGKFINATMSKNVLKRDIQLNLEQDNYQVKKLDIKDGTIDLDAEAKDPE